MTFFGDFFGSNSEVEKNFIKVLSLFIIFRIYQTNIQKKL